MPKELESLLMKSIQDDFHGDTELFLKHINDVIETFKVAKAERQRPAKSGNPIITLSNISKEYVVGRESIRAVKDVSLEIIEGEIIALVGPSGSGKSTLLNMIGGLDRPTSGEIVVNGKALKAMSDHDISSYRNQTIGFIFQFFNLQPYLNVQENVEIPLIFRGEIPSRRAEAARESIKAVGLEERIKHLPNQLSGGQMQRVAIARSLVNKPKIILADEPTGNLDRATGIEILNLIKEINKEFNTTVIIVTHDPFVANQADRVITLSDGKLV